MIIREHLNETVSSSQAVVTTIRGILKLESEIDQDREHFWVLGLNTKNTIKYIELSSLGTMTSSLIHPRETFRLAIMKGCASIICVHNHPSGDPTPSRDDIAITGRLKSAGEIIGIQVLDHIIIGNGSDGQYVSLREKGII